jgi:hypothetical protein
MKSDDLVPSSKMPLPRQFRHSTGLAPAKKVSWDLDSDDELIVTMKQQRYTDVQIADYLAEQGRVQYNFKTINSRYKRILAAIERHEEERLDSGLTHWTDEDVSNAVYHAYTSWESVVLIFAKGRETVGGRQEGRGSSRGEDRTDQEQEVGVCG